MKPTRPNFKKAMAKSVQDYTASVSYDRRLAKHDINGSIAHARMLGEQGIVSGADSRAMVDGLRALADELDQGAFQFKEELEDIHMNIESALADRIGAVAGKLHTGRSRNDQIALDMRLFTKEAITDVLGGILDLQRALVVQAEANLPTVFPGYTHLQRAQPVLLAHHFLAYFQMLQRDVGRFRDCLHRTDVMPLGSGALAGAPYPLDRERVAQELGFSRLSENSIDAVADRDFVVEFQAAASLTMMHLSRLAEEIILWSSLEFGLIELDESYATGSSIMPQKKNPDVAELARARTGRTYGNLMGTLTMLKGLPLAYNRDLQEDKESLFDSVDTLKMTLDVFTGMISSLKVNKGFAREVAGKGYALATDVADYLAKKGVPFREAHEIVGNVVGYALDQRKELSALSLDEYQRFSTRFERDVLSISVDSSVASRNLTGGTSGEVVMQAINQARKLMEGRPDA